MLSDAQIERYSRQLILPEIGPAGQERLLAGSVALAGDPGANAVASLYLAGAGVGRLTLLHSGHAERETDGEASGSMPEPSNPDSSLVRLHLRHEEVTTVLAEHDVVILSGGDAPLRAAVNRACVERAIALVYGAAAGAQGFLVTFAGHRSHAPCYDCAAATLPTQTTEDRDLGAATGDLLGTLQATEAIKLLLGIGGIAGGQMVVWDLRSYTFSPRTLEKNLACPTCAGRGPRS